MQRDYSGPRNAFQKGNNNEMIASDNASVGSKDSENSSGSFRPVPLSEWIERAHNEIGDATPSPRQRDSLSSSCGRNDSSFITSDAYLHQALAIGFSLTDGICRAEEAQLVPSHRGKKGVRPDREEKQELPSPPMLPRSTA